MDGKERASIEDKGCIDTIRCFSNQANQQRYLKNPVVEQSDFRASNYSVFFVIHRTQEKMAKQISNREQDTTSFGDV
jgi:hypothetical protein